MRRTHSGTSAPFELFKRRPVPLALHCGIQNYAWGERGVNAYIPDLLGIRAERAKAYAELWVGAHSLKSSWTYISGKKIKISDLIGTTAPLILGRNAAAHFGNQLPFLMKVLTASRPLSIQVHPNKHQAEKGFSRENSLGIPPDAQCRSYRDNNHKPELLIALGDFYALSCFRPPDEIAALLKSVEELSGIMPDFGIRLERGRSGRTVCRELLRILYEEIMTMSSTRVNRILGRLVNRLKKENREKRFKKNRIEYWLLRADEEYSKGENKDRGLFSFYLLNLVRLGAGESIFIDDGEPHAYLEGRGIEVMSNSDNVLRGGLTSKHLDIPELLRTVTFRSGTPEIISADAQGIYKTPAKEFEARVIEIIRNHSYSREQMASVEILLVVRGEVKVQTPNGTLILRRGGTVLIPAVIGSYHIAAESPTATLYACSLPGAKIKQGAARSI